MKSLISVSLVAMMIGAAIAACAPFRDSIFSNQLLRSERDLNTKAIPKVQNIESDGKIRIALMADSHQNYKDLDSAINDINRVDVDFVANLGDFTNSSYNLEYDQFIDSFSRIVHPAFTAIGNHDALGAGIELFTMAFGSPNFYFESATKRYIFFHSANLEDQRGFDPAWLKATVQSSTKKVFIFTHVALRDPERYTGDVAQIMNDVIMDPNVQLVLNGHNHVYQLGSDNNTIMLQSPRVQGNKWLILEIQGNQLDIKRMDTGETTSVTLK